MEKSTSSKDIVKILEEDLELSFAKLENVIKKPIKNQDIYKKQLVLRKNFIDWTHTKFKMLRAGSPVNVFKRDIFYCSMGYNIGSEQQDKRPVVIVQNDRGNKSSETTIVVPITTHQNCKIYEEDGKRYYKYINSSGVEKIKKLDYYEVPIDLDPSSKNEILGFINCAQIKTISKKRLSNLPVAKISYENFSDIKKSINRLLFT
ncbi:type II toxin-antitoxin system PemK/MazF family toxin [Niallia sp. FSL M8-0099]|uniref:type II toxin-antitoxin system PemK/MazF family toxin n=1 Tax=Niallia sp. FSL M8-0099 TaxID=2954519 RepID=UPI0030F7BCD1